MKKIQFLLVITLIVISMISLLATDTLVGAMGYQRQALTCIPTGKTCTITRCATCPGHKRKQCNPGKEMSCIYDDGSTGKECWSTMPGYWYNCGPCDWCPQ